MLWQFYIFRLAVLAVRCDCGSSLTVMFFLPALSCGQKAQLKLKWKVITGRFVLLSSWPVWFDSCRSSWTWPPWSRRWFLEWPLTWNSSLTAFWVWWPTSSPSPITTKVHETCTSARWVSTVAPSAASPWARRSQGGISHVSISVCFVFFFLFEVVNHIDKQGALHQLRRGVNIWQLCCHPPSCQVDLLLTSS